MAVSAALATREYSVSAAAPVAVPLPRGYTRLQFLGSLNFLSASLLMPCLGWVKSVNSETGLISFRIDWFDLLAVQGDSQEFPAPQFKSINSSVLSHPYGPTLTSICDCWKNHSFDYMDLFWQNDVSAF